MQFSLTIKSGLDEISKLNGRKIDATNITIADVNKVIEVEQWLEKIFGYRFHIHEVLAGPGKEY